ncbi:MAG: hypothetical protein ACP5XB_07255, partial [Isosphaeraceae bacterium]
MSTNFPNENVSGEDWISQAEAAQLRGVSRQAISKLIRFGRLRTLEIGGHVLVSRHEILGFEQRPAGRPKSSHDKTIERILGLLHSCDKSSRREIYNVLRAEFPVHPLEDKLGAPAELILEAIDRAGPLTLRGIRGVLAESAFEINVIRNLKGWASLPTTNDPP